jgi:hypothetical protein
LVTLTVAVTDVLAAVIEMVSAADDASTACPMVLQLGEPVVQVLEPLPGTSHVVAAACVADTKTKRKAADRDRRIVIENLAWVDWLPKRGESPCDSIAEAPVR